MGFTGALLLTLGTLSLQVAFSVTEKRFALVSDMFGRWPLAGSLTFGLGCSMLGMALHRDDKSSSSSSSNTITIATSIVSAWVVVGSSHEGGGPDWIYTVHALATLVFIPSSYAVYYYAAAAGAAHHQHHGKEFVAACISAAILFFSAFACFSGGVMYFAKQQRQQSQAYWVWKQALATSEAALLASYFLGYLELFLYSFFV